MNQCNFIGRLTADPELRQTPNNIPVCRFTLAVPRPNVRDKTDFIHFVAWRQQAEFISKYFVKGKPIAICGVLTISENKKDGVKHYYTEVVVNTVEFIPQEKGEQKAGGQAVPTTEQPPQELPGNLSDFEEIGNDDDLPF